MTDKACELLELALKALEFDVSAKRTDEIKKEIRAYLAEPEPDPVYLFAGWLTCQPGIMEVGACCDASPMAQAIDQYFQEHPERMFETKLHPAPRQEFVRLSEAEVSEILSSAHTPYEAVCATENRLVEKNK